MPSGITGSRTGRPRVAWALAFAVVLGLAGAVQARGDDGAEARKHAQRASNLAASGKCRQAVAEWNKAMAILRDPALLFNRGECYRKLGDTDAALGDYRQFLSDLPKAPNRGEVERRIAELTAQKNKDKDKDTAPPPAPVLVPPVVAAPPPSPPTARPAPAPTPVAQETAPMPATAPVPAAAPASAEPAPNPALQLGAPADSPSPAVSAEGGITTRPWFWITVAAVAVAAGVGTFIVLSRDSTNIPSTALGNYKF